MPYCEFVKIERNTPGKHTVEVDNPEPPNEFLLIPTESTYSSERQEIRLPTTIVILLSCFVGYKHAIGANTQKLSALFTFNRYCPFISHHVPFSGAQILISTSDCLVMGPI